MKSQGPQSKIIFTIAITEILIGAITILMNLFSLILFYNLKKYNVFVFVIATSSLSMYIGYNLFYFRKLAYQLLIYFSSVIILSKLLIFADIIHLNGALENAIPSVWKNLISIFYHSALILYLSQDKIQRLFVEKTPALDKAPV